MVVKESPSFELSENLDKLNSNDYGFILSSKYENNQFSSVSLASKLSKQKPSTETNSPIKRWNKHAKAESQGRIQLMSHVFYS